MSNPENKLIELEFGFKRADQQVLQITLIKPNTGHCRGLSLKDVLSFEINALAILLPRITLPAMTAKEVYLLELMDTLKIAEGITGFLETSKNSPAA